MDFIFTQGSFSVLYVWSTVTPSRTQRSYRKQASEFPNTRVGLLLGLLLSFRISPSGALMEPILFVVVMRAFTLSKEF